MTDDILTALIIIYMIALLWIILWDSERRNK
jgi:hypothetical protein